MRIGQPVLENFSSETQMVLGCGKFKTNYRTQQGGQVVRHVGFEGRSGPGRECMLMSGSREEAMVLLVGRTR